MVSIQIEIKYLKRAARILIFKLQIDMNQIFQMRDYRALQIKGLQSYKPANFSKTKDGPWASFKHIAILAERDQAILIIFDIEL